MSVFSTISLVNRRNRLRRGEFGRLSKQLTAGRRGSKPAKAGPTLESYLRSFDRSTSDREEKKS